ncbi:MAG: pyridoxamine 5'-phosphate oxidase family protein [Bryobacterales bacterium]|nr:pyridoxamine 5'-phosphate oxidase family protein [Bryobacterales bacterium]
MSSFRTDLLALLRRERYAVASTVNAEGKPQSALVGIAVTDGFDLIFDTLAGTRKAANLRRDPRIAFVIGPTANNASCTVQYEGVAEELTGEDRDAMLPLYYEVFPDGRPRRNWPGLIYFRVKPTWIRYSNYAFDPPEIVELGPEDLG